jgi:hypothetical protein
VRNHLLIQEFLQVVVDFHPVFLLFRHHQLQIQSRLVGFGVAGIKHFCDVFEEFEEFFFVEFLLLFFQGLVGIGSAVVHVVRVLCCGRRAVLAHHAERVVLLVQFFALYLVEHFHQSFDLVAVLDQGFFDHQGQKLNQHQVFGLDLAYGCVEVFDLLLAERCFFLEFLLLLELQH